MKAAHPGSCRRWRRRAPPGRSTATAATPTTTATSIAGTFGAKARSAKISTSATTPTTSVGRLASSSWRTSSASLPKKPVPPPSTPSSLESWPTAMTRARPATKPVSTGRAKKSAMNPARARPAASSSAPTSRASSAERAMKRPPSPKRERRDGGRGVRRDRRARPDRQLPAGAQGGVREQRRQRGEEPGLRRHAGERGIRHALRHEHGPDRHRRDQVRAQPAAAGSGAASRGWAATVVPAGTSAQAASPYPSPPGRCPSANRRWRHSTSSPWSASSIRVCPVPVAGLGTALGVRRAMPGVLTE